MEIVLMCSYHPGIYGGDACCLRVGKDGLINATNLKMKGTMKVIIRDMTTGNYVNGPTSWGDRQSEAMEFKNSIGALEFCVTQKIHNVEILLLMGDPRTEAPLRLFPRSTPGVVLPNRVRAQEKQPAMAGA
jgi:hypothetical protein